MSDLTENQLEIAKKLYQQGVVNGAAIIAGNFLIDTLLSLGKRFNIPRRIVEYKAGDINAGDRLNQTLLELNAYDLNMHNQIKMWLSLRTEAAMNREDYTIKEVGQMINGIEKFVDDFL